MNDKNNLKGQDCSGSRIPPPDPFNKTAESEGHVISDVQPDTDMSDLSFDRPDPDNQLTDFDYFPHSKDTKLSLDFQSHKTPDSEPSYGVRRFTSEHPIHDIYLPDLTQ